MVNNGIGGRPQTGFPPIFISYSLLHLYMPHLSEVYIKLNAGLFTEFGIPSQ